MTTEETELAMAIGRVQGLTIAVEMIEAANAEPPEHLTADERVIWRLQALRRLGERLQALQQTIAADARAVAEAAAQAAVKH